MGRLKNRLFARLLTAFPKLSERAVEKVGPIVIEGIPWAPFTKGLKDSRMAIVTTAGVHLKSQTPFDMKDPNGDPTFRELPKDTPKTDYVITHDYYDHRDADRDINIVYPIDRLLEFEREGVIKEISGIHYGFMGHIDGPHVKTLMEETAPRVAAGLKRQGVDAVILTPG